MRNGIFVKCPLVLVAMSMIIGIIIATYVAFPILILPVLAGMVVIALLLRRFEYWQSGAIVVCCLLLGMWLMQRHLSAPAETLTDSQLERCQTYFIHQRSVLLERLSAGGVDGDTYAVVAAMSLGDKSALTRDLKETYSVSGASHVLALSGLHLGIVYMLFSLFLPRRRWPAVSQLCLLLAVWIFVFLVGMPISAMRSAIMLSVYGLLSIGHRNRMSVNALAFTAIILLMWNPAWLFDVSFQLSFMAVWAILMFVPLFESVFPSEFLMSHRWLKWMWGMVAVSCSAQLAVAPLVAYYFGRFSTYFLLTNFIVIPAAFVILWLVLVVLAFPSVAYLLLYVVQWLNTVLQAIASWPGASVEGLHPNTLQVVLIYVLIGCVYLLIGRIRPLVGWKPSKRAL
ncbi:MULTISPECIES: ComEC/Rec2 family competence protein [unclassified Prevotella]|uniref:ComEC/Rec2 family competence protein n=1 Tax=unclassified Prevotella TaxID=2638335 RepID=UPI000688788E|nr:MULTISPECIES: ComEC/Rec2 family competence protein [unclassified Prevotella]